MARELLESAQVHSIEPAVKDRIRTAAPRQRPGWTPVVCRLGLVLAAGLAALLRFFHIGAWPPWVDEGSYAGAVMQVKDLPVWAAAQQATLLAWKPPLWVLLQVWLMPVVGDELTAGRLISAGAGVMTTVLTGWLGARLGGGVAGALAALLYAVAPVAVFHERQIHEDSLLTTCTLAAAMFAWTGIERRSLRYGLTGAVLGALSVQVKVTALFLLPLLVVMVAVTWLTSRDRAPWRSPRDLAVAGLPLAGTCASYVLLMLSPLGDILATQNDALLEPFKFLIDNVAALIDAMVTYFPGGLVVAVVVGLVWLAIRSLPSAVVVLAALGVWTVPLIALSLQFPSHYASPAMPYCCALAAFALAQVIYLAERRALLVRIAVAAGVAVMVGFAAVASWRLVVDIDHASLSVLDDRSVRGSGGGYGYREAALLIRSRAEPGSAVAYDLGHPMFRAVALNYRPLPDGVSSLGVIEPHEAIPDLPRHVYVLVGTQIRKEEEKLPPRSDDREFQRHNPRAVEIQHFRRPDSDDGVTVYEIPAANVDPQQMPVLLRWQWTNGSWGWSPIEWVGQSWQRSTNGANSVRFDLDADGVVTLAGSLSAPLAPVDVDLLVDEKRIGTVNLATTDLASFRVSASDLKAGPHRLSVSAHLLGETTLNASVLLPLTVYDVRMTVDQTGAAKAGP